MHTLNDYSNRTLFELGFQKNYMLEMVEIFKRVCLVYSILIFENYLRMHGRTNYYRPVLHVLLFLHMQPMQSQVRVRNYRCATCGEHPNRKTSNMARMSIHDRSMAVGKFVTGNAVRHVRLTACFIIV